MVDVVDGAGAGGCEGRGGGGGGGECSVADSGEALVEAEFLPHLKAFRETECSALDATVDAAVGEPVGVACVVESV